MRLFAALELGTLERRPQYVLAATERPTASVLLARLSLPPGTAGLALVNGLHAGGTHPLNPGDEVALFPPLGGG